MKNIYIFAAILSAIMLTPSPVLGQRVISSIDIESFYQNDIEGTGQMTIEYNQAGQIVHAVFKSLANIDIEHKIAVSGNALAYDMNMYMHDMLVMSMPMAGTLQDGRLMQLASTTTSPYGEGANMSFTYDNSGRVVKASTEYTEDNEVITSEMTWSDGNMVQETVTATSWENGGVIHFNYTSLPSNTLLGSLFGFSNGPEPTDVFPANSFMGTLSANLISSIVCEWNNGEHVELIYDWETDATGEVTAVNVTKNGRNIYKYTFNWSGSSDAVQAPTSRPAVNAPWHDLSGRKVNNPVKGINIRRGEKVLFLQ